MKRRTVVGLLCGIVLTVAFTAQTQVLAGGVPSSVAQSGTSGAANPAPTPTSRKANLAVPGAIDQSSSAWYGYYNNPEDTGTWQAFCVAQGGSDYVAVSGVVPAVPACRPTLNSDPSVAIPGCGSGPCDHTVSASQWLASAWVQQCVELVERYLYLRYGWGGVPSVGGTLVRNYANAYPGPVKLLRLNDGKSAAPMVGDVISFSGSTNSDDANGHVAIVTDVQVTGKTGKVSFTGQNQTLDHTVATSSVNMSMTPQGGWKLNQWWHYPTIEWLHAQPIITFSEFTVGTSIARQYQTDGIWFSGAHPYITGDASNPTSPVLSGTPLFQGSITGTFVVPGTTQPTTVKGFSVDIGYINNLNSVELIYFDAKGKKIGSLRTGAFGIDTLDVTSSVPIGSFTVHALISEPNGWAIDNVAIHFQ